MTIPQRVWRRRVTESLIIGCMVVVTFSQAVADDLIVIRCVGYQEAIVMFPSGEVVGFAPKDEPFDVYISPSRGIGWWSGSGIRIDEEQPATLAMNPTMYRLDVTRNLGTNETSEWIILDRIAGTVSQFAQAKGTPTEVLKRGGTCRKIEPKF